MGVMQRIQWLDLFDERQQKEIFFSQTYAKDYAHGTDGHNAKLLIAKMADILTKLETSGKSADWIVNTIQGKDE